MQNELFAQGLSLMALGMGVVFVFLALLVVTTYSMSAIIGRYFPEPLVVAPIAVADNRDQTGDLPDASTIAVIQEAIRLHRNA